MVHLGSVLICDVCLLHVVRLGSVLICDVCFLHVFVNSEYDTLGRCVDL